MSEIGTTGDRTPPPSTLYGLIAEFEDPDKLVAAAEKVREEGYRKIDAYTPFPVHGLAEALAFHDWRVPWLIFICGCLGGITGFSLEASTATPFVQMLPRFARMLPTMNEISYPLNVGGRPFLSWPTFIPPAYELTILFAAFGAFFGMLALSGLPKPYNSIFNAKRFELATQDRFFLCIEALDPKFNYENTWEFLQNLGADSVSEVER
ncbi:MAG TPA: DUF3341 domain-containing protein [Chthonomonadaceae bacterium]|nr:DUF3341 domain-containing protein [Chthonomonadaceae bacterium]